jgi:small subunit ribosomal protein S4
MANKPRPKARISRALGIALTPKSARYLERRPYPPGEHGRGRKQTSDYKVRLREKQRLRAQYDLGERQLRRAFDDARRRQTATGEELLRALETRLDATVLRAGFARTIYQARQFVTHQHILVNGKRVDRPSYRLRPGDVVSVAERSKRMLPFMEAAAGGHAGQTPEYLDVNLSELTARLVRQPDRSEIPVICEEQLVVEFYSR